MMNDESNADEFKKLPREDESSSEEDGSSEGEDDPDNIMIPSSFEDLDPLALSSLPPSM